MEKIKDVLCAGCKSLSFSVLGKPVPQARPRFGNGWAYDKKESREYKKIVHDAAQEAVITNNWIMAHEEMPIRMTLVIYKPIPDYRPQWYKKAAIAGFVAPLKRTGDIENIAKGIMDAMSGLVYKDDAQVYSLTLEQRYAEEPHVDVFVDALFVNNGDVKDAVSRRVVLSHEML